MRLFKQFVSLSSFKLEDDGLLLSTPSNDVANYYQVENTCPSRQSPINIQVRHTHFSTGSVPTNTVSCPWWLLIPVQAQHSIFEHLYL